MTWDLPALLPIQEEGALQIFIALKIHHLGYALSTGGYFCGT
jgi:hypothetical protein